MKSELKIKFNPWRFYFLSAIILVIVAGLIARMIDLTVLKRHFLQTQGNARALRVQGETAFRGMILDRNGYPLAISASVFSVWINPKEFSGDKANVQHIAEILGVEPKAINNLFLQSKKRKREFVYIKRLVQPDAAQQLKSLKIPGLYLQQEYKRYYPEGEVAAHVIGFTNIDDRGQEGLELAYNDWLSGAAGKKLVVKDRLGRVISEVQTLRPEKTGHDLQLSIDRRIQYLAYRELMDAVKKNLAASGSVVVMDVKTGEILAMVNQPSFNPNQIASQQKDALCNRAVTDIFEPGSTVKAFSVASALESGKFTPETLIDTKPIRINRYTFHDTHYRGMITLTEVLKYSSDVGVSKVALASPADHLWSLLHRAGFGEITGVGFPGEQNGRLVRPAAGNPLALASMSFGYGMSVTALQLAHAYTILANDGVKLPATLLRIEKLPKGERVISEKVAHEMVSMLQTVVEKGGTAQAAQVPGYRVAGKSGTAWISGGRSGYQRHRYISSFVGMAPASHPRLVIAVIIHDPQGKHYYGGFVSGPVFEKIMEGSLRILNIPPDDPASML